MTRLTAIALLAGSSLFAAEPHLGKPFTLKDPVAVKDVVAKPDAWVGKTVQVKGKVTEVCRMAGCWMELTDGAASLRVKVNDGDIVFAEQSIGKLAVAEGTLKKFELTREQTVAMARHEAEEMGRKFDPATIKAGKVLYQIAGTGAQVLE